MAKEVFYVVIVNRRFVLILFFKYRYWHRLGTSIILKVLV